MPSCAHKKYLWLSQKNYTNMQNFNKIKQNAESIYGDLGEVGYKFAVKLFYNAKPKSSNLSDKSKNVSFAQNKMIKKK